jgi:fructokinase
MSAAGQPYVFGEVLFDHFPDGNRVLGGAPFNVAWHLAAFGQSPQFISRVGNDPEGERVRNAMAQWGLTRRHLQTDPVRPTGQVAVTFADGEPAYDIVPDCAYDHIEPVAPDHCALLYHGSLAARSTTSADALRKLRAAGPHTVFIDVNLRSPWWHIDTLRELLEGAHWVKLNSDELVTLSGAEASTQTARNFLQHYQLRGLLVTHGARGAELLLANGERLQVAPLPGIEVIDTVGAGDAFASVMLLGLLRGWDMPLTLQRAQAFAAAIVGQRGATVAEPEFYRGFSRQWHLNT